MTTLIEQIKADQLQARKSYDAKKALLLSTLIGEATAIGKNDGNREVTDSEVVAVIKKFIKNMNETLGHLRENQPNAKAILLVEIDTLTEYLPKQLTEQELQSVIEILVIEVGQNMGKIMGELKSRYDGRYDGKSASTMIKSLL